MIGQSTQLIGEAPAWLSAQEHVSRVAPLERPILVIGERGTGKELIGERLHFLSKRWEGPFVKVNCAALSEQLLDSELFGHERGAFTGATEQRKGRFELADGGTIFLDEIATASRAVQEKLLRIVEYGEFQRLGGSRVMTTNVRIVAATNMDLPAMVERGDFRADLLDRLAFDVITLPPLRARKGDATLLADFFARRIAIEMAQDFPGFAPSAIAAIEAHDWPGNVRELRNFAQRLAHRSMLTAPDEPVRFDPSALDPFASPWRPGASSRATADAPRFDLPDASAIHGPVDFNAAISRLELRLVDEALAASQGHQGRAADALGLTYHQFRGLLKKHGYGKKPGKPDV
ncbi:MAG: ATPase AAA [Hyphomonas sp. BRH_c22]|uniref:phage shock protein operon transcriptional activator n=1 Tax=Hyphomonas sp. BRH_c22 TaxID=1629710 RepID=UPI0005F17929|nr:phage shock protein operon transcriptional activator [Hyphomonas sp. BRH_c22]KJS34684.1 MAG: ATPase AAA [Hyphomonas sp. BRH_c22]